MKQVLIDRGSTYADIADNGQAFDRILRGLGVDRAPNMNPVMFHCMSNIATKLARFATGDAYHEDTFVDIAGYAILIAAHHRRIKAWQEAGK